MDNTQVSPSLPFQTGATPSGEYLLKALLFTAVLLGACYLLLWLGRRYGLIRVRPRGAAGQFEILESLRVNAHTSVYALRFHGKTLLLAESSRRVALRDMGVVGEQTEGEPTP